MDDPQPEPLRPLARHGVLEVDAFCDGCGYNLHGQIVSRDERLNLLICRCPECAKYHAAGKATSASSVWLSRFGVALLAIWMCGVLATTVAALFFLGLMQYGYTQSFTYMTMIAPDGRSVSYAIGSNNSGTGFVYTGTQQQATEWTYVRTLDGDTAERSNMYYRGGRRDDQWLEWFWICLGAAAIGFVTGMLIAVALWHWPRRRYPFAMLLPALSAVFLTCIFIITDEYQLIRGWAISRGLAVAALEAVALGLGLLVGRPIARTFVRLIVPPKPRQLLTFLWKADGKEPPAARFSAN